MVADDVRIGEARMFVDGEGVVDADGVAGIQTGLDFERHEALSFAY